MNPKLSLIYLLIAAIVIISYRGFSNPILTQRYLFNINAIKTAKQYERFITSAFFHADWVHLLFNMYTLYIFSQFIFESKKSISILMFMFIFFASVLAGSAFSYFLHKNQPYYSALGASAGVTGIVMAAVVINPYAGLALLILPIPIPAFIFGFLYLVYSIYSLYKGNDNIGHDAHLGGAAAGLFMALTIFPHALIQYKYEILLLISPLVVLAFLIFKPKS